MPMKRRSVAPRCYRTALTVVRMSAISAGWVSGVEVAHGDGVHGEGVCGDELVGPQSGLDVAELAARDGEAVNDPF
jgi:hypothetical protein